MKSALGLGVLFTLTMGATLGQSCATQQTGTLQYPAPAAPADTSRDCLGIFIKQFKADNSFAKQFEVAKRLAALGETCVLSDLEPYLKDADRHVRGNAAFVFAKLGDDRGFEVIKAIVNDRSPRPPGQGVGFISGSPDAIRAALADPQKQIAADRGYAVFLFGNLKDRRAVPLLVPLLTDEDVHYNVPWALAQTGDESAIPPLIRTLTDKNPDIRFLAIQALVTLRARQSLPQLRLLLDDSNEIRISPGGPVSEHARVAIDKLRG